MKQVIFFIAVAVTCICWGFQTSYSQDDSPIKVNTVLLNAPVFVSDKNGKAVSGLTKDDFELSVDGQKQKVEYFEDKGAITVAIVIDTNSNTSDVLDQMRRDAQRFVDLLGPDDQAMVIRVDMGYKVVCELTSDRKKLRRAIGTINSHRERVRLLDKALHQVVHHELVNAEGRKAIIVFGDPDSAIDINHSAAHFKFTEDWIAESDVAIYPIFYQTTTFPSKFVGKSLTIAQLVKIPPVETFNFFAVRTGGRFFAAGAGNLETVYPQIIDEIGRHYTLGLYMDVDAGEKNRNVSIKTVRPDFIVRAKQSIRAGASEARKKEVARFMAVRIK